MAEQNHRHIDSDTETYICCQHTHGTRLSVLVNSIYTKFFIAPVKVVKCTSLNIGVGLIVTLITAPYKWQFLNVSGSKPIPRSSHSLNVVNGTVYVMGGEHEPRVPIGSAVWSLDVTAAKWRQLETKGVEVPPRNAHASAVVGSSIFIFGGRHGIAMGEGAMNDMYELDTTTATWKQVSSSGDIPPPRSYHSMAAIGSTLYVFGGCGTEGRHNDLHSFDTNTGTWQALPTFDPILPRGGTGFVAIGRKLYVVGGFTGQEMSDMYEFNTESSRWRQVKAVPVLPARSVFGIAALGSRIFVVGGEVDPSTQGHAGAGEFSKDVYVLDTEDEGEGWQKAEPADDAIFTERGWLPAAALDASRIIAFGGIALDNSRSDETYILHVGK